MTRLALAFAFAALALSEHLAELPADDECGGAGSAAEPACALNAMQLRKSKAVQAEEGMPAEELVDSPEAAMLQAIDAEVKAQPCYKCDAGCRLNYNNGQAVIKKCPPAQPWYVVQRDYCVASCGAPAPAPAPHRPPAPAPMPPYVHTTRKPVHPSPAPHGGSCVTETSGSCRIMGCAKSRGKAKCVKGKCVCATGACASKDKKMCLPAPPAHR